ncbi:hypothetical protein [Muricoccus vinaceus]|uniref:Uncharacterized protein n=1 Tax=Muricoccus vinaceus TaxID=424704 RepID=A0ABV6IM64_9PROT
MADTAAAERRILTEPEYAVVAETHHPALGTRSREELRALAEQLSAMDAKVREITRQRAREKRGKAVAPAGGPAPEEAGAARRKQVIAAAIKRLNRQIARMG